MYRRGQKVHFNTMRLKAEVHYLTLSDNMHTFARETQTSKEKSQLSIIP